MTNNAHREDCVQFLETALQGELLSEQASKHIEEKTPSLVTPVKRQRREYPATDPVGRNFSKDRMISEVPLFTPHGPGVSSGEDPVTKSKLSKVDECLENLEWGKKATAILAAQMDCLTRNELQIVLLKCIKAHPDECMSILRDTWLRSTTNPIDGEKTSSTVVSLATFSEM
eukprot:GHVL01021607.1.p2 GENE.GHVL01021607.1~~GHVL01021607.1.p2  ORF type:complete len:172 (+),score=29.48 GHVL01021607.1:408-923(+)